MGEVLKHPMTLLVFGAVLSGILVPTITSRAQRRRAAYELKVALVEDLSGEAAAFLVSLNRLMMMAHLSDAEERQTARWDAANDASSAWEIATARLGTVMDAHFGRADLRDGVDQLSQFFDLCFAMIYYVIDPRNDRAGAPAAYKKLLQLGNELNVDLSSLPAEVEEYIRRAEAPGPVGLMWAPLKAASSKAVSDLARGILASEVISSQGHRNR